MPRHKPKRPPQQAHWGRSHVSSPQRNLVPGRPIVNMGFSMRDEARHTVNNNRIWDRNNELRNRPVTFISSGMIEPLKILGPQERDDVQSPILPEGNGETTAVQEAQEADSTALGHITTNITSSVDSVSHPVTSQDEPPTSNVPTHISPSDTTNPGPDTPDSNEQGDSDSSEEVILFRGRGRKEGSGKKPLRSKYKEKGQKCHSQPLEAEEQSECSDQAEDVMADYIANIADSDKEDLVSLLLANPAFIRRDLGGNIEQEPDSDDMDVETDSGMTADERQADQEDDDDTDEVAADVDDKDMARLYAKQGGFRLGDNDWAHFDGQLDGSRKQSNSRTSSDRLSQALEGMDIGTNNPVFQKKKRKGKAKCDFEFNVDDSELEERLRRAWDNDRARKKEKKAQREALRMQGLLGENKLYDPLDLRTKYPLGISRIEIKEELKAFISGQGQRLIFPPMDPYGRSDIHKMAHKLGLTSKSEGGGDTRHTVLHRTTRSMRNVILEFDTLITLKGRRYFHRSDVGGNAASKADTTKNTTGGHGGLRYRDGEVVSASVPQLGEGNKGRTMLERMGWSKGMALGAEHNKGILEPVAQVVKTTKAGLGT